MFKGNLVSREIGALGVHNPPDAISRVLGDLIAGILSPTLPRLLKEIHNVGLPSFE